MYIKRKLENTILQYLESQEIIAIVGPRQAGKTTLLKEIQKRCEKSAFFTFEDRKMLDLFERATDEFIDVYIRPYSYVFIDEFQYATEGGRILKYIYDTAHTKIFISGSSAIDLTVKTVKFLVGRIFVYELLSFDFEEYLTATAPQLLPAYRPMRWLPGDQAATADMVLPGHGIYQELLDRYDAYLRFGGYPRVVMADTDEEKRSVLRNMYNTYFLREVRDILGLVDTYALEALIRSLALQIGNLVNYHELGRTTGLSYQSIKKYLSFLEKTYICFLTRPYFSNKRVEIVKNPKVYFFDTGFRNHIVDDARRISERVDAGALLENGVFSQLKKHGVAPQFWRNKQKEEVDVIIPLSGRGMAAVEIKRKQPHTQNAYRGLRQFVSDYPKSIPRLATFDRPEHDTEGKISIVSVMAF